MKILLIHTAYQFKGGEDSVVAQEIALLQQKYEVEVVYFQNDAGAKGALQFLASLWNRRAAKKIKDKIKQFQPDLVHIHNWHFALGPLVFRVIHSLGIPVVHTVHNYRLLCPSAILLHNGRLFTDSLQQSFPWKAVQNKVYRSSASQTFWLAFVVWFHKKIGTWKLIDTYVCLTPFAVKLFKQSNFGIAEEQFTVKPNFTHSTAIIQLPEKENHFLFIGRLSEEKGIKTLINAFRELPFKLRIAGDGPLTESVQMNSKVKNTITYLGNLNATEVRIELAKAQALIFPSIWFEGMPMTILEALSTKTPIIASNLGAMTSLITDGSNGFHFEPGNITSLKEVIHRFNSLSALEKNQMGKNAFENYKTHYAADLQLSYFETIYNKVVKKKGRIV